MAYLVVHVDDDPVSFGDVEERHRPLSIDADSWTLLHPVWVCWNPGNIPVESYRCRVCYEPEGQERKQSNKKVGQ